jgi:hypothetical protein
MTQGTLFIIADRIAVAEKHLATSLGYYSQAKHHGKLEELAVAAMKFADRASFLFEEAQRLHKAGLPHSQELVRAVYMLESAEVTLKDASILFANEGYS